MKTACLLLFAVSCLNAQSVIKKVFSAITVATVSSPILNQGQTTHTLYVQYLNSSGTCSLSVNVGYLQIEASYDGLTYFGITSAPVGLSQISGGFAGTISASAGPFPYIRANLYSNAPANCAVSAWYSGGTYSVSQPQMMQAVNGQWRQLLLTGATADRSIAGLGSGVRAVIYAATITNMSATDFMTVTITENPTVCTTGAFNTFASFSIATGQTIVIPGGPVPFVIAERTASVLCAHFASVSLDYSMSAITRLEQ